MPDWERTDAEIIEASLVDPAAFEEIFQRHYSAVYRHAVRRVGVAEAVDLAADVFVRALALRDRYDLSRADCLPWLYGIAANLAGDRLRRLRQRAGKASPPARSDDTTEDADSRLEAERLAGLINPVLQSLSDDDRKTFLLYALDELTYGEIADLLGVPPGTVGSRITRVRRLILDAVPDLEERLGGGE